MRKFFIGDRVTQFISFRLITDAKGHIIFTFVIKIFLFSYEIWANQYNQKALNINCLLV